MHTLRWKNVRWTDRDPATARLHCPSCDYEIDDTERIAILSKGEWRAGQPDRRERSVASFHIWEAYSPFSSLEEIVSSFLRAREAQKAGDKAEMHTWQNTTLGEPVQLDTGEGVEPHALLRRIEPFETPAPAGVCCLTVGVDTQDDRLEVLVLGWGPGEESWIVDRHRLNGDPDQPGVWNQLDELLARSYEHPADRRLEILATCIDSAGHKTSSVYEWVSSKVRTGRRVFATIGRSGQRPIVSAPSPKRWGTKPRPVSLYTVGADAAKALIMGRLGLTDPGPGFVHIPLADWADEDLANQLTSERLVTRYSKGVPVQEWRPVRPGQRNEALDCFVLALAALRLARVDLPLLMQRLTKKKTTSAPRAARRRHELDVPDDWLEGRH
jgi:phage terminase large subunit GpA-like protein